MFEKASVHPKIISTVFPNDLQTDLVKTSVKKFMHIRKDTGTTPERGWFWAIPAVEPLGGSVPYHN